MKYLLVLALVFVVFWVWRKNREAEQGDAAAARSRAARPAANPGTGITEVVACDVCQVHLPKSEALIGNGNKGFYCSDAHRRQARG